MYYSIGDVSNITGIASSKLRYYDREGLLPTIRRSNGGIRVFTELEINTLKIIECLKSSGMSIKDIKQYMDLYAEGDSTLYQRRNLFYERMEVVKEQMKILENTMAIIKLKCWHYDASIAAGSEEVIKNMPPEEMPDDIREILKLFA